MRGAAAFVCYLRSNGPVRSFSVFNVLFFFGPPGLVQKRMGTEIEHDVFTFLRRKTSPPVAKTWVVDLKIAKLTKLKNLLFFKKIFLIHECILNRTIVLKALKCTRSRNKCNQFALALNNIFILLHTYRYHLFCHKYTPFF